MARYKILLKATASREYQALASKADRRRVVSKIGALTEDPRPTGSSNLPEHEYLRRMIFGGYRVIYRVDDFHKRITIFRIVQRRPKNTAR